MITPFKQPWTVDRSGWLAGPWDNEPDHVAWTDAVTQLPCAIMRHELFGFLCGYVAVPPGHPLHGKQYNERVAIPQGAMDRRVNIARDLGYVGAFTASFGCDQEGGEALLSLILFCHGGLTYSGKAAGANDVWWFGFDAGHVEDAGPNPSLQFGHADAVYRDVPYMRAACERLAWQIKVLADGGRLGDL